MKLAHFITPIAMWLASCNGMFYFPAKEALYDPSEVGQSYQAFRVSVEPGIELAAWEFLPKRKSMGVILHFHGNAENMTTHFMFSSWLAERGFTVVTFDYRGYGESTGSAYRAGMVQDGLAMLRNVADRYAKQPIFVFAQSIGGAVAVPAVAQTQVPIQAFVIESSFSSYRRIARQKLGSIWLTWPLQYPLSFLVTDGLSPEEYAPQVKVPTLFVHGTADPVVPMEFGRELYAAMGSAEKEFWEVPGGGHTPAFIRDTSRFRDRLVIYLKSHIPL